MLHRKVLVFAILLQTVCTWAAQHRNKALYPAALRMKRGVVNPTFQNSIEDVNLLFEILLAGVQMEDEHSAFSVRDEELASLRRTHTLAAICEDVLPRKLTDIRRLTSDLSRHHGPLQRGDFERTVLTMVYTAYRQAHTRGHQRDVWAESFLNLYRAIKQDLTAQ
ncbi:hypothetical protein AAFF_G00083260 [Aldrovandia affinis]|uniref:Protein FAM180A n=1 Tax=Aldrovandia affinis TaxID=143900 RepID=A0AAD7RZT6_9TELE|nr:hypothetical protein AAFF_G00083260 [Aldrovandia affinis]